MRRDRRALVFALLAAAVFTFTGSALGQGYPNRPIKLVVPFPPGGNGDFVARTIQPGLAEFLHQPVPAGTPQAIVAKLADALSRVLTQPEVREQFASQGQLVATSTPEEFRARIEAEREQWRSIARTARIELD